MTPINYELFEYNKMMLTYGLTIIIVGAWISKMILQRKILIRRTPFDVPIAIFLISQLLSTLFSIDRHTSFWGYYSRFHGGLLSTFSYIILYYSLVSNIKKRESLRYLHWLLGSVFLVSFYGILEHFGIDAKYWVQDVQNRVFSTLGQPNWLAAWLAVLIPLPIALVLQQRFSWSFNKKSLKFAIYYLLFTFFLLCLLYTKSRSGLLGFAVSWSFFWGFTAWCYCRLQKPLQRILLCNFLISHFLIIVLASLAGTPFTPSLSDFLKQLPKKTWAAESAIAPQPTPTIIPEVLRGGTESLEIRKIVWQGALAIWRAYPVFGSGVETFAYSYYNFRPVEHNLVSEWDFLYNKAHNEYLNFLATTGTVGLGTYLLLIGWIIVWNLKNLKCQISNVKSTSKNSKFKNKKVLDLNRSFEFCALSFALFAGWLSILFTNFFGFSVVPVALLFFLFPGASVIIREKDKNNDKEKDKNQIAGIQYGTIALVALTSLFLLYLLSRFWYADTLFAKAKKAEKQGDYSTSYKLSQKAVNLNKNEPIYRDALAYAASGLAEQSFLLKREEEAQKLASKAIDESDKALAISPRNLNFWRTRAKIYYKLTTLDTSYLEKALETLKKAGQLAPTDAKIFYNMGLVYFQLDQPEKAIETLEKTVEMKKNYQDARYALGQQRKGN